MPKGPRVAEWFTTSEGQLCLDARAFPVLFSTWRGDAEIAHADAYYDWTAACATVAKAEGTQLVSILDLRDARPPDAPVRKHMAAKASNDPAADVLLNNYMIITSRAIRGVVTAVMWISGDLKVVFKGSLEDAIAGALADYKKAGLPVPRLASAGYEPPPLSPPRS
jgi:hypothetical protein